MSTVFRIINVTWVKKPPASRQPGGYWEVAIDLEHFGVNLGTKKLADLVQQQLERQSGGTVRTLQFEKAPSIFVVSEASSDSEWEDIFQEVFIASHGIVSLIHQARGGLSDKIVLVTEDKSRALTAARAQLRLNKVAI